MHIVSVCCKFMYFLGRYYWPQSVDDCGGVASELYLFLKLHFVPWLFIISWKGQLK